MSGVLSVTVCRGGCRSRPTLMLQRVACFPSMREPAGREIASNAGINGRSKAVRWDGCKTSPLAAQIAHKHSQRWRGSGPEAQMFHPPSTGTHVFRCKCTHVLTTKQMYTCRNPPLRYTPNHTHTEFSSAVSSQTAHILLGCAPISRINEQVSHFTVQQHVVLWGINGERLQFIKSVFNNIIDF